MLGSSFFFFRAESGPRVLEVAERAGVVQGELEHVRGRRVRFLDLRLRLGVVGGKEAQEGRRDGRPGVGVALDAARVPVALNSDQGCSPTRAEASRRIP